MPEYSGQSVRPCVTVSGHVNSGPSSTVLQYNALAHCFSTTTLPDAARGADAVSRHQYRGPWMAMTVVSMCIYSVAERACLPAVLCVCPCVYTGRYAVHACVCV